MTKGRLEAFSDGVLAIIITIMVLELKAPHGITLTALKPLWPVLVSYFASFIFVGIYWSNHHHLFHAADHVDGGVLWANLHLLFWLSLTPFVTAWISDSHFAAWPMAAYGLVLLMSGVAYYILVRALIACAVHTGHNAQLAEAIGTDGKGKLSVLVYAVAIPLAFVRPWLAGALYGAVALLWLIPDRRIEKRVRH